MWAAETRLARRAAGWYGREMRSGFTLVEITTVLVIIALIVGGILIGRDIVAAAGLRATLGQIESYNSAVQAFRQKYGGHPGDLSRIEASVYGLFTFDAGLNLGNGNGVFDLADPGSPNRQFSGEAPAFWRHLSEAGLIEGAFGTAGNGEVETDGTLTGPVTDIAQSIPPARLGRRNFITAYSSSGVNYYEINAVTRISALGSHQVTRPGLVPSEAHMIDDKIDDGLAGSGTVVARGRVGLSGALNQLPDSTPSASPCVVDLSTTPVVYALSFPEPSCALRIEMARH